MRTSDLSSTCWHVLPRPTGDLPNLVQFQQKLLHYTFCFVFFCFFTLHFFALDPCLKGAFSEDMKWIFSVSEEFTGYRRRVRVFFVELSVSNLGDFSNEKRKKGKKRQERVVSQWTYKRTLMRISSLSSTCSHVFPTCSFHWT